MECRNGGEGVTMYNADYIYIYNKRARCDAINKSFFLSALCDLSRESYPRKNAKLYK